MCQHSITQVLYTILNNCIPVCYNCGKKGRSGAFFGASRETNSNAHTGVGASKLSEAVAGHFRRDKLYNLLSQQYHIPMLLERVRMFIKYCEACQKNHTCRLEKCPHKMKPILIPKNHGLK